MKRIDLIAGARPNFMKIAPIIDAPNAARSKGGPLRFRLIHTGQHYDRAMSGSFFEELGIPDPDMNLEVGSAQAEQTAGIMVGYEKVPWRKKERSLPGGGEMQRPPWPAPSSPERWAFPWRMWKVASVHMTGPCLKKSTGS